MNRLYKKYCDVCNKYVEEFCKKQEFDFDGWVGDDVGGIALCGDFFFNLHDIITDINLNMPVGEILNWYNENLEGGYINYWSYTKGLRNEKTTL